MNLKIYIARRQFKWDLEHNGLKTAKIAQNRILKHPKKYATWWAIEVSRLIPLAEMHLPAKDKKGEVINPDLLVEIINSPARYRQFKDYEKQKKEEQKRRMEQIRQWLKDNPEKPWTTKR